MKNNPVGFFLNQIRSEQFAILEENYIETKGEKINLNTGISFKTDSKNKFVTCFVSFTFEHENKPFIKIQVMCNFEIIEKSWDSFINNDKSLIIIPDGFLSHLATITIGTARGVLFAKTEGTQFNKFILPTINVLDLIKKDGEFPI